MAGQVEHASGRWSAVPRAVVLGAAKSADTAGPGAATRAGKGFLFEHRGTTAPSGTLVDFQFAEIRGGGG